MPRIRIATATASGNISRRRDLSTSSGRFSSTSRLFCRCDVTASPESVRGKIAADVTIHQINVHHSGYSDVVEYSVGSIKCVIFICRTPHTNTSWSFNNSMSDLHFATHRGSSPHLTSARKRHKVVLIAANTQKRAEMYKFFWRKNEFQSYTTLYVYNARISDFAFQDTSASGIFSVNIFPAKTPW